MGAPLSDEDLAEIEARLTAALQVVSGPWVAQLETRAPIGGSTFIQGGDPKRDEEIYVQLALGGSVVDSPDERLDTVVAFIGCAPADVGALVMEVRRLRGN